MVFTNIELQMYEIGSKSVFAHAVDRYLLNLFFNVTT